MHCVERTVTTSEYRHLSTQSRL
uniref:Uncharacterized protein n=1 Tax=Anguilla anguilla TaxID=7936 RepID=A0A0E9UL02_ANGAN